MNTAKKTMQKDTNYFIDEQQICFRLFGYLSVCSYFCHCFLKKHERYGKERMERD